MMSSTTKSTVPVGIRISLIPSSAPGVAGATCDRARPLATASKDPAVARAARGDKPGLGRPNPGSTEVEGRLYRVRSPHLSRAGHRFRVKWP